MFAKINGRASTKIKEKYESLVLSLSSGTSSTDTDDGPVISSTESPSLEPSPFISSETSDSQIPTPYTWSPYLTQVILPSTVAYCQATGSFVPVYKTEDCSPLFLVPTECPIAGLPMLTEKDLEDEINKGIMHPPVNCEHNTDYSERFEKFSLEDEHVAPELPKERPRKPKHRRKHEINTSYGRRIPKSSSQPHFCTFCKSNGESSEVYLTHKLKTKDGKVICPILSKYECPICHATGEFAHTRRYCPVDFQLDGNEYMGIFKVPRVVRTAAGGNKICRY